MQVTESSTADQSDPIQVGRQAIFDRDLGVHAYELLYRDAQGRNTMSDGDQASSLTLLNAFMEIGLDRIVGPHKAFINLTRHFFVDMPPIPFSPERVVFEVLEDIEVDDVLLDRLATMASQGFALAMDDYAFQPELAPILPLVRYIKVEVQPDRLDELAQRLPALRANGAKLLAEKVETAEQFERLKAMGFDYFQGYFFARPNLVRSSRLHESSGMVTQLLARLNDPAVVMDEVVQLVSQDPGLSFKVLRYINSAAVGLPRKIESIQRAVMLMGLQRIRAWASLFAMSGLEGRPVELLNMGLLRANLCEHFARLGRQGRPDTAYTVGLLSILDAMLGRPIETLMRELPLPDEIRRAIAAREGLYGDILDRVIRIERNQWPDIAASGLAPAQALEAYASSSAAAFDTLAALSAA